MNAESLSPPLVPLREPAGARVASLMGRHWVLLPLCTLLLWAALALRLPQDNADLHFGEAAPRDITAPQAATVLDRELTRRNRESAADLVPPEYDGRPGAQDQALADLRAELGRLHRAIFDATKSKPSTSVKPNSLFSQARAISPVRWNTVERAAERAVRAVYVSGGKVQQIRSDVENDLLESRARMRAALVPLRAPLRLTPREEAFALALAQRSARYTNVVVNDDKTERARRAAYRAVPEIYRKVLPGTLLVEAGTRIDAEKWAQLQALDLVAPSFHPLVALGKLLLCVLLVCFAASYVVHFHRALLNQPSSLWLTAMLPVAFVLIFRAMLRVPHGEQTMVPLAATVAMLITILLNARLGFVCAFVVATACALMARSAVSTFLMTALGAWVGVLAVSEIASRFQLVRAALILAATNVALALSFGLWGETASADLGSSALWSGFAGALSVGVTAGLAMFLERPFGITTHLRLLELSAPDEIVMRRMQSEAPGTYTHSLMVSMLGEAAAKSVGADPLLCRVGGLYHDIGKLRRPQCFVENQSGDNVHDRLAPQLSALLIIAHVKDGLELGRALRLPQPVLDIIGQHHGDGILQFFYHRANQQLRESMARESEKSTPENVGDLARDENAFRYCGPRPQSKEAAIVLLADSVEASSRALPNLTPEKLEAHIQSMIAARLAENQLSECDLTLRDLKTIESSFAHVLRGVLHQRIEYPDPSRQSPNWTHDALSDPRNESRSEASREGPNARFPHLPRFERRQNREEKLDVRSGIVKAEKPANAEPEKREVSRRERRRAQREAQLREAQRSAHSQLPEAANATQNLSENHEEISIANGVHVAATNGASANGANASGSDNPSQDDTSASGATSRDDQPFVESSGKPIYEDGAPGIVQFQRVAEHEDTEFQNSNGGANVPERAAKR